MAAVVQPAVVAQGDDVLAIIFILQNRRRTTVRFLIPESMTPLWVALFVGVLVGVIAGALLAYRRQD